MVDPSAPVSMWPLSWPHWQSARLDLCGLQEHLKQSREVLSCIDDVQQFTCRGRQLP